jgi:hypothetical protein
MQKALATHSIGMMSNKDSKKSSFFADSKRQSRILRPLLFILAQLTDQFKKKPFLTAVLCF